MKAFRRRSTDLSSNGNLSRRSKGDRYAGFDLDNQHGGILMRRSTITSMTTLPFNVGHPTSFYNQNCDIIEGSVLEGQNRSIRQPGQNANSPCTSMHNGSAPLSPTLSEQDEDPMPPDDEVKQRFSSLLEEMVLPPERVIELEAQPVAQKWKMLKAQEAMREGKHSVHFYLDQLERYMQPHLYSKNPPKKLTKGLIGIEFLLTSLEVDLRTSPNATWLREFIDEPQNGHVVLLKLLNYLQERATYNISPDRTQTKKKTDPITVDATTEYQCLLCIKAIMKNKYGFQTVLKAPRSFPIMAKCLRLNSLKTKTIVLKIFTQACEQESGHSKVLQALDEFKVYTFERQRFERLIASIFTKPYNVAYQVTVLEFLNAIISAASNLNHRVYFQQDIENAGFNPDTIEEAVSGTESEEIKEQLKKWRNNCIDVGSTIDEFVTLRGRTVLLRDEVDLLQSKLEETHKEKSKIIAEKKELEARVEDFKFRALELQSTIENLKKHRQEGSSKDNDVTHALEDAIEDILHTTNPPEPPPPPLVTPPNTLPPPPPPPGPAFSPHHSKKGTTLPSKSPHVRLPILNWQPITASSDTSIFKNQDKSLSQTLDFKEFEEIFELKSSAESEFLKNKRDQVLQKLSSQVTLLQPNRAKNLVIAKRRVGLSDDTIKNAVNKTDLVTLPCELAELLLKFVPSKEELSKLAKHAKEFDKMAEAEQFLFKMAKIERYENKLSVMTYMGLFDELVRTVLPQIDSITSASITVAKSKELKKILEIILAYGNFMNASRRGQARGFKLESLSKLEDTKSSDKRITFLHYLVDVIASKFPELNCFYEKLDLDNTEKVAMQTLAADVQSLRKGLDLVKAERDKQPDNFVIHNFYERAIGKVHKIGEKYRKMDEVYKEVCLMFDEDPKLKEPADFFKSFADFVSKYKTAEKDNFDRKKQQLTLEKVQRLSMRRKKVAKEAAEKARQRLTSSSSESSGRGSFGDYPTNTYYINGHSHYSMLSWNSNDMIEANGISPT